MVAEDITKSEMIVLTRQAKHYTDLLIKQCDNWLPETSLGEASRFVENRSKRPRLQSRQEP